MKRMHQWAIGARGEPYALLSIWPDRAHLVRYSGGPPATLGLQTDDLSRVEAADLLRMYRHRQPAMTIAVHDPDLGSDQYCRMCGKGPTVNYDGRTPRELWPAGILCSMDCVRRFMGWVMGPLDRAEAEADQ